MIELEHINKSYRLNEQIYSALIDLNLQIVDGDLVALMGSSGSGKTTTLNILGLLDTPDSGRYIINGVDLFTLNPDEVAQFRNQTFGFIFQSFFLLTRLNILDNVGLPLTYRNMRPDDIDQHAMEALQKVGIAEKAYYKPNQLSGGQQQRVAIARALVGNPKIILADEPTGALDTKTGQSIMDLLIDINKNMKTTVIIVTHDPRIASQCHRTVHMVDGKIVS